MTDHIPASPAPHAAGGSTGTSPTAGTPADPGGGASPGEHDRAAYLSTSAPGLDTSTVGFDDAIGADGS